MIDRGVVDYLHELVPTNQFDRPPFSLTFLDSVTNLLNVLAEDSRVEEVVVFSTLYK